MLVYVTFSYKINVYHTVIHGVIVPEAGRIIEWINHASIHLLKLMNSGANLRHVVGLRMRRKLTGLSPTPADIFSHAHFKGRKHFFG